MDLTQNVRLLTVIILIAWMSQVVYLFYPSPKETIDKTATVFHELAKKNEATLYWMKNHGDSQIEIKDVATGVKNELWLDWFIQLAIIVVGLVSGLMALLAIRFWQLAVIAASLLYLTVWLGLNITNNMSLIRAYEIKWVMATSPYPVISFIHRDIVLPLFYVGVTILLTATHVTGRGRLG